MKNTDFCASFRSEETSVFKCTKKDEPYKYSVCKPKSSENGARSSFSCSSSEFFS
jgi:hypothetical protein